MKIELVSTGIIIILSVVLISFLTLDIKIGFNVNQINEETKCLDFYDIYIKHCEEHKILLPERGCDFLYEIYEKECKSYQEFTNGLKFLGKNNEG